MKNPTYATFMKEVESLTSKLAKNDLIKIILNLADKQSVATRNQFLQNIKENNEHPIETDGDQIISDISPENFLKEIREYEQRILNGEFFNEEENYRAYDREEHSYWSNDYYESDEIDYSNEEYVLEAVALLDKAKKFFRRQDINTAFTAYKMLFNIFENPDYYEGEEYFVYDFSFEDVIDTEVLKEHKTIYFRCQYLNCESTDDFKKIYYILRKEKNIFLNDLMEIDRKPLPNLDNFIDGFIQLLSSDANYDSHLIDALFVKAGMDEVRKFAYSEGNRHPSIFLYYYEYAKENQFSQADLLSLLLDGIKIIPEKYRIRSYLGVDLVKIAKESNDKNNLLIGYSTAFYSNPSLRNLAFYVNFLLSENIITEIDRLKDYLSGQNIKRPNSNYLYFPIDDIQRSRDIYSLETAKIDLKALIVGRYILDGIEPLINIINPNHFLGFSADNNCVAIVTALALKSISMESTVIIVDKLLNHYCLNITSGEYQILKKLISDRSGNYPFTQQLIHKTLEKIESLAANRVSRILGGKLRGGYDSACLLLVACAEVKHLVTKDGNNLIKRIDTEYKRFSAFRKPLKNLTSESRHLISIK